MAIRLRSSIVLAIACLCANAHCAQAEFVPVTGFDQQLFPSYVIATANMRWSEAPADPRRLGDPAGILGVDLVSPAAGAAVTVTVECEDFLDHSVWSGTLPEAGACYRITPKIRYRYDQLARCEQAAPINVTFRVQVGSGVEKEQIVTCTLRSINDCPYAFRDGEEVIDFSLAFAAYVNEQHPFVDKLLREALDRDVVQKFQGYQARDPDEVLRQAYAIWDVLVARDIRYSSITTSAVASDSVASQHVRLIEDSINNSQANCVDGSVLMVSLLRKIGIDGFLVITPDHCYAGFYLDPTHQAPLAIETTLLGTEIDQDKVEVPPAVDTAIGPGLRYDESFYSFVAALEHGTDAYVKSTTETPAEGAAAVDIIDIAEMRKLGVLPIPFQHTQEFAGYDFRASDAETESSAATTDASTAETAPDAVAEEAPAGDAAGKTDDDAPSEAAGEDRVWEDDAPFRDGIHSLFAG
jgi:hypothetical protein